MNLVLQRQVKIQNLWKQNVEFIVKDGYFSLYMIHRTLKQANE